MKSGYVERSFSGGGSCSSRSATRNRFPCAYRNAWRAISASSIASPPELTIRDRSLSSLLPPTKLHDALCYICAMRLKDLAIAAMLVSLAFVAAASTAQTANPPSPTAGATTPAASPVSGPGDANPALQTNCQGGPCDAPPPHITIARSEEH